MGWNARGGGPARLREVQDQITLWRHTREKRSPMPAALWAAAVALARREGTYRIARALRVDYASLARRVAEAGVPQDGGAARAGGFVELTGAQLLGGTAQAGPVVEVCDRDGRLTIRLSTDAQLDVAAVVHGFRAGRP